MHPSGGLNIMHHAVGIQTINTLFEQMFQATQFTVGQMRCNARPNWPDTLHFGRPIYCGAGPG